MAAAPKSPISNTHDVQVEQAPPATIREAREGAAHESSSPPPPSPPSRPPLGVEPVGIPSMPPIVPIPPEGAACVTSNKPECVPHREAAPAAAGDGPDSEPNGGRSQRDSSSDSGGTGPAAAKYGAAQASMPRNFRLSLDGYELQSDGDGKYAAYRISVTAGLHTWQILRR